MFMHVKHIDFSILWCEVTWGFIQLQYKTPFSDRTLSYQNFDTESVYHILIEITHTCC